jgi:hypothetical protein
VESGAVSRAFLYVTFSVPVKDPPPGSPNRAHAEICCISGALIQLSLKIPSKQTPPHVPQQGPYGERRPFPKPSSTRTLITRLSLKVPDKGASLHVYQQGPLKRDALSPEPVVCSFFYILESSVKEPSHEMGENMRSPSREPHIY